MFRTVIIFPINKSLCKNQQAEIDALKDTLKKVKVIIFGESDFDEYMFEELEKVLKP